MSHDNDLGSERCRATEAGWLDDYVDGALEEDRRRQFEEHVESCAACRDELDLALELQQALGSLPTMQCPPEVVARVEAGRAPSQSGARSGWARAAAGLGIIAAGLLAGLLFLGDRQGAVPGDVPTQAELKQAELEQAEEELRFALAYFGGIARKAGMTLRDDVLAERVLEPPRRALQRLNAPLPAPPANSAEENS